MNETEAKKKDYEMHKNAGNMALTVSDLLSAYTNFMTCGQLADEISNLTLEKKEADEYASLASDDYKQANDLLNKLHLSKEEEAKLVKRKLPKGFDKFIGEDKLKEYVKKEIIEPWRRHEFSSRKKSALLIYGPEGVSKKVFVQSLIHELQATPYFINPVENFSPYGENIQESFKKLFRLAEEKDNVVFYFTKPVAFFPADNCKENKLTAKIFLKLIKKEIKRVHRLNLNILFVASTPAVDKMTKKAFDKYLFDDLLRVHHPDRMTRKGLMEERLKGIEFEDKDTIDKLVPITHGYISKEISRLCRRIRDTARLYGKDGKNAIITPDMMKRIMQDLGPMDDVGFQKNVDAFEASLKPCVSIVNDNHD
jgi:SpoVK/Ycf46/Vps4 family AAA+-type ATPase